MRASYLAFILISELHRLRNSDTGLKVTFKIYNFGLLVQSMYTYNKQDNLSLQCK